MKKIARDHDWDKTTTPVCLHNDFSYYSKNGLYAGSFEQLNSIIKAFGGKISNVFRIKLSRNIRLPGDTGEHLVQMVLNEVVQPGKRMQASYGWNENTRCFFAKII